MNADEEGAYRGEGEGAEKRAARRMNADRRGREERMRRDNRIDRMTGRRQMAGILDPRPGTRNPKPGTSSSEPQMNTDEGG